LLDGYVSQERGVHGHEVHPWRESQVVDRGMNASLEVAMVRYSTALYLLWLALLGIGNVGGWVSRGPEYHGFPAHVGEEGCQLL
jgi:hypothetical protein